MRVADSPDLSGMIHFHDVQMGALETKTLTASYLVTGAAIAIAAGLIWFLIATAE